MNAGRDEMQGWGSNATHPDGSLCTHRSTKDESLALLSTRFSFLFTEKIALNFNRDSVNFPLLGICNGFVLKQLN